MKQFDVTPDMTEARAATFGWLCVETAIKQAMLMTIARSHLRVAVC